jgi:hypothetical protein
MQAFARCKAMRVSPDWCVISDDPTLSERGGTSAGDRAAGSREREHRRASRVKAQRRTEKVLDAWDTP